jgi:hypothetical protein
MRGPWRKGGMTRLSTSAIFRSGDALVGVLKRLNNAIDAFSIQASRIKTDAAIPCEGDLSRSAWAIAFFELV